MAHKKPIQVKILGKDYQVSCAAEEKEALMNAAEALDERMRKVRDSGAIVGHDRIAVMVALNLCHELAEAHSQSLPSRDESNSIEYLSNKIRDALEP